MCSSTSLQPCLKWTCCPTLLLVARAASGDHALALLAPQDVRRQPSFSSHLRYPAILPRKVISARKGRWHCNSCGQSFMWRTLSLSAFRQHIIECKQRNGTVTLLSPAMHGDVATAGAGSDVRAGQRRAETEDQERDDRCEDSTDDAQEEEDTHDYACMVCGVGGDLLCCEFDGCTKTANVDCAGLSTEPTGNWCFATAAHVCLSCPLCAPEHRRRPFGPHAIEHASSPCQVHVES